MPEKDNDKLTAIVEGMVSDPTRFTEFVDSWNQQFGDVLGEDIVKSATSAPTESAFDSLATSALSSIARRDADDRIRADIGHLLNRFPHAALMVESGGRISASNDFAYGRLEVDTGDHIDDLPFNLMEAEPMSEAISDVLGELTDSDQICLKRAFEASTGRPVSLAIVPFQGSASHTPSVLMFIIDPVWRDDTARLLKQAFGLTETEAGITGAFMSGQSLREISKERNRSLATVRTQFQSILNKTGAPTQLDLLRIALGLSQFVADVEPITKVAAKPERKRVDVLRSKGRVVDVMFYGKPGGRLLLLMHSLFTRTLPPAIEAQISDAGFQVAAIARPGIGNTSPEPAGENVLDCGVDDVRAVLDQLEVEKAHLLALVSAAPAAFAICGQLPERIISPVIIGGACPAPFVNFSSRSSSWTKALGTAAKVSPQMATLVGRSGTRLIKAIGLKRFMARLNTKSAIDAEVMSRDDVIEEIDSGLDFVLAQGIGANVAEVILCFDDWSHLVNKSKIPVTLLQGYSDPHSTIESATAFANAYPDKIILKSFEDGGQSLLFTHTQDVLTALGAAATERPSLK